MSERHRIRRLFRIRRFERDIAEELRFHFDRTVEELMQSGRPRDEAEREGRRRFGTEWWYRRELMRIDRGAAARQWLADRLRGARDAALQVLGAVRRSPGLSAAIVAALALGIGVNGTMFRIVDRLWLSPPAHIEAPDEVVRVLVDRFESYSGRRHATPALSYPDYEDLRSARGFADIAASTTTELTLGHGEAAERLTAVVATGGYFRMLGVRPAIGRFFDEADDIAGVAPVIVLSYGYWQRAFGGSTAVLGQTIDVGRGRYQIIGVAPRHFTGVDLSRVDMWLPLHPAGAAGLVISDAFFTQALTARPMLWLGAQARIAPGATSVAAAAEATALHRGGRAERIAAGRYDAEAEVVLAPMIAARGPLARPETDVAGWLAVVALLVLLIACVNVANLLLARVVRQRHEIGIRLALGVPRVRLVGQLLLEGLLLSLAGGALALGIAHLAAPALGTKLLPDVDWSATALGSRAILVTAVLAALAGLLSGLPPAIQAARRTVVDALRTSAAGGVARSTARVRGVLVLAQATMSVLLLVGAALFLRSLEHLRNADLGFEPRDVFVAFPTFAQGSITAAERAAYLRDALERLERVPSIDVAGLSDTSPFTNIIYDQASVPGRDFTDTPNGGQANLHTVSPGYFDALGLRVTEGRSFGARDRDGAPAVAVINRTLARAGWPGGSALGGCVEVRETCLTVIGVVENPSLTSLEPTERFQVWMPAAQHSLATQGRVLVRASGGRSAAHVKDAIRRELIAMDPRVRFVEVRSIREIMSPSTRSWELGATVFSAFGALAVLLAALGLYSVLAFDVAQRMRELGVRAALGATRARLMGDVIARGLRVTTIGVGIGLMLAWLLAPRLADLLFGVSPRDLISYGGAAIALLLVALVASAVPARTAIRADPVRALRSE